MRTGAPGLDFGDKEWHSCGMAEDQPEDNRDRAKKEPKKIKRTIATEVKVAHAIELLSTGQVRSVKQACDISKAQHKHVSERLREQEEAIRRKSIELRGNMAEKAISLRSELLEAAQKAVDILNATLSDINDDIDSGQVMRKPSPKNVSALQSGLATATRAIRSLTGIDVQEKLFLQAAKQSGKSSKAPDMSFDVIDV